MNISSYDRRVLYGWEHLEIGLENLGLRQCTEFLKSLRKPGKVRGFCSTLKNEDSFFWLERNFAPHSHAPSRKMRISALKFCANMFEKNEKVQEFYVKKTLNTQGIVWVLRNPRNIFTLGLSGDSAP